MHAFKLRSPKSAILDLFKRVNDSPGFQKGAPGRTRPPLSGSRRAPASPRRSTASPPPDLRFIQFLFRGYSGFQRGWRAGIPGALPPDSFHRGVCQHLRVQGLGLLSRALGARLLRRKDRRRPLLAICTEERICIELMTSDRKLKASIEGSK